MFPSETELTGPVLEGENGNRLIWAPVGKSRSDPSRINFRAIVCTDWFEARVAGGVSDDRFKTFLTDLGDLLALDTEKACFINEYGNVEVNMTLLKRGSVLVEGILIKSMGEDSRIEFEFPTDLQNLKRFQDQLRRDVKQYL